MRLGQFIVIDPEKKNSSCVIVAVAVSVQLSNFAQFSQTENELASVL